MWKQAWIGLSMEYCVFLTISFQLTAHVPDICFCREDPIEKGFWRHPFNWQHGLSALPVIICPVNVPSHPEICNLNHSLGTLAGQKAVPGKCAEWRICLNVLFSENKQQFPCIKQSNIMIPLHNPRFLKKNVYLAAISRWIKWFSSKYIQPCKRNVN